ncbi:MAG: hypothetical protein ACKVKX_10310, partial [Pseudomonadales bacterium]
SWSITAAGVITAAGGNSGNWNTAYGWGNHASGGYAPVSTTVTTTGNQSIDGIKTFTGTNVTLDNPANNWKYIRLQSAGSVKWDIATNEADDSSSLQFRAAGGGTNRVTVSQAGNLTATGTVTATGGNSTNWNTAYGWGNHASAGYTNDQTAAEILTAIKTVDGSGSGLDADLLDGLSSVKFPYYRGIVAGDWDTIFTTASNQLQTSGLYQVQNLASGHSNHPTGVYTYGGVFAWQLANSTFKLYSSHTGDLSFQSGWGNDEYSGWRRILTTSYYGDAWRSSNDGAGSGLDADLLDGQHGSYYYQASNPSGYTTNTGTLTAETVSSTNAVTITGTKYFQPAGTATSPLGGGGGASLQAYTTGTTAAYMAFHRSGAYAINWGLDTSNAMVLGGWSSSTTAARMSIGTNGLMVTAGQGNLWGAGNDGAGSGLDADLLDGNHASAFMLAGAAPNAHVHSYLPLAGGTMTGNLILNRNTNNYFEVNSTNTGEAMTRYNNTTSNLWYTGIRSSAQLVGTTGYHIYSAAHGQTSFGITADGYVKGARAGTFWGSSNDGSGSTLDADLLDGQHGSYYYQASNPTGYLIASGSIAESHRVSGSAFATAASSPGSALEYQQASGQTDTRLAPSGDWHNSIRMGHGNPYNYYSNTIAARMTGTGVGDLYTQSIHNNTAQGWRKIWSTGNDGSGSTLDADLLDGQHGSYYAPASHNHSGVYLPIAGKAADSNLLDGIDSTGFVRQLGDSTTGPNYLDPSSRRVNPNA